MPKKRFMALRKFNRAILNPITRSLAAGRVSLCSLLYHVGRRSGKEYATPVMAIIKGGHIYIPLTYGPDTDWFLNVQAAGLCQVKIERKVYFAGDPQLVDATAAAAAFPNNFRTQYEKFRLNQFLRLTVKAESRVISSSFGICEVIEHANGCGRGIATKPDQVTMHNNLGKKAE